MTHFARKSFLSWQICVKFVQGCVRHYMQNLCKKFTQTNEIFVWRGFRDNVKKFERWVPRELNAHQMKKRSNACVSLLSRNKGETFLHRMVSCNKKWNIYDNRKCSACWLDKDKKQQNTTQKPNIHQKKLMFTAWWSNHGSIHYSFIKSGQSQQRPTVSNWTTWWRIW